MEREILEAALVGYQAQAAQIEAKMQELRELIGEEAGSGNTGRSVGRPRNTSKTDTPAPRNTGGGRQMSEEGRARIAAAQKARWAKAKEEREAEAKRKQEVQEARAKALEKARAARKANKATTAAE